MSPPLPADVTWGYIDLPRGKVLCAGLNAEQIVLIEPNGGYFYPYDEKIQPHQAPSDDDLACALSGVPIDVLKAIATFCSEPRSMREIEDQFPGVKAWHLRRLGFLRDTGRRSRAIVSQWVGYTRPELFAAVNQLAEIGNRNKTDRISSIVR
jgi:hypothetical protein